MIRNDQQRDITRDQLVRMRDGLQRFDQTASLRPVHPQLQKAQREALLSVISDLEQQLAVYEQNREEQ